MSFDINKIDESIRVISSLNEIELKTLTEFLVRSNLLDIPYMVKLRSDMLDDELMRARNNQRILSEAGILLSEKLFNKINDIKNDQKRQVSLAMAKSLMDGGGFKDTKYLSELKKVIDFSELDKEWYQDTWAIK